MPAALTVAQDATLFAMICGLLGLLIGSFLNVVIHRLPKMMDRDWRLHCAELRGEEAPRWSTSRWPRPDRDARPVVTASRRWRTFPC
jgi:leader peptidase (prepilin peptidase)/N-methyltransferase